MQFLVLFSMLATVLSVSLDKRHTFSAASLLSEAGGKEKILEMIEQLRDDNDATIKKFTKQKDDATSDEAAKKATFDASVLAEERALGSVANKTLEIDGLQADVDSKRVVEVAAENALTIAKKNEAASSKFLAEEEVRIDDEKDLLNDVLAILDQLAASAALLETDLIDSPATRRLLSIVDLSSLAEADPAAISEVRGMINDLLVAGEADRASAQEADRVAKEELAHAKDVHKKAWDILAMAIGRVDFATIELGELKVAAGKATAAREVAEKAHEVSADALTAATNELAIEDTRVKKEEAIFVQVSDLLATLQ